MKDANKILIVGLAAYFLFMRQSQASDGNGGAGGSSNGGAGGSSNGGAGGSSNGGAGGSTGGGLPNGFPDLPGISGPAAPPFNPSRTVVTADGRTVVVVDQACPSANNPFVGTIIDQQSGREVGVCAGDPRIDGPTYQPLNQSPLALV